MRPIDDGREDRELVSAAQGGDRRALESLLERQYDRVYAICRRMAGNDADGADAAQEAMIAIVRGLPRFDQRARFSTWAHKVAVNACLDELRRRARRPEPTSDQALALVATGDTVETVADRVDIDVAMARVPLEFRAAVVLRDLCGLDYAEIAEVLSIPPGTVRSRIARGRVVLAGLLAPQGNPAAPDQRPTDQS